MEKKTIKLKSTEELQKMSYEDLNYEFDDISTIMGEYINNLHELIEEAERTNE